MDLYLVAGAATIALIVLALFGGRTIRRRGALKKAQTRLEWGDRKVAARLFEEAGDLKRAIALYAEAGDRLQALKVSLKLKNPDGAVEALRGATAAEIEEGLQLLQAARALDDRSRASTLAALARAAGNHKVAAALFEQLGNAEETRAARLQEARTLGAQGKALDAAALYERLGESRAAAASFVEAARREADAAKKKELAEKASVLLKKAGDFPGAAEALAIGGDLDGGVQLLLASPQPAAAPQLLQWHGQHARAGELFEKFGEFKSASKAWSLAGDPRRAATALEKARDPAGAARLLLDAKDPRGAAQVHLRAGAHAAAAELLAGLGDLDAAVKIWSDAGEIDPAVQLLCKHGRARDAAALLESRGAHERASLLLAESGDLEQRAKVLAAKHDFEGAAQAYLDLGRPEDAKRILQQSNLLSAPARFLMARACMAGSQFEEATAHFAALLDGSGGSRGVERADALYGLARAFEAMGRLREAITSLEELCQVNPKYRDASLRLRLIQARLESPGGGIAQQSTPIPLVQGSGAAASEGAPGRPSGVPPRYQVEGELGRGAMGVVYRAVDTQLGRTVAIKVLESQAGTNPRIREYFLREARAVAQLNHPNIVTLFDAGLEGSSPYLVMELVDGKDLRDHLQLGPLAPADALPLIAGVASALDYAHSRKIVHRDVKPENILVSTEGPAKLMDFGVAHTVRDTEERHATVIGTPVYMAPEQIKGEGVAGWTDTYALGCVLFETLTGLPPFDPKGALYHHVNTPPPDPLQFKPELDPAIAKLVLHCLEKRPQDRPPSSKVVADLLIELARRAA